MLTGDQNLLDLAYSVRWNIRTPELYLFQMAQPDETIREVAESAMRAVVSQVTLNDAMGDRRAEIEAQVAAEHAADPRFLPFGHPGPGHRHQAGRSARRGQRRVQAGHRGAAGGADPTSTAPMPIRFSCARRRRAKRPRSTRSTSSTGWRPKSPAGACITRRWSRCCPRSTRRSSRRRASRPICRCPQVQKQQQQQPQERAAMIEFVRRRPIAVGGRRRSCCCSSCSAASRSCPETKQAVVVRFGKPVRILNRYQAGPADRRRRRRHLLAHSRSPSRWCGSTSASRTSTCSASRCCRPTSAGSRSMPSPATGSSTRC